MVCKHIKELKLAEAFEEDKDIENDPSKLLKKIKSLKDDKSQLEASLDTYLSENTKLKQENEDVMNELIEAKAHIELLLKENQTSKDLLEYERGLRQKDEQRLLNEDLNNRFEMLQAQFAEAQEANNNKDTIEAIWKVWNKLDNESEIISKSNKNISSIIRGVEAKVAEATKVATDTKNELKNMKSGMYSVQRDSRVSNFYLDANNTGMKGSYSPRYGLNASSIDDDFYMDDDLRQRAEEMSKNVQPRKQSSHSPKHKRNESNRLSILNTTQEPVELVEVTYEDLEEILAAYLNEQCIIDDKSDLNIDCENKKHLLFLEALWYKILPSLNSISFSNIDSSYEIVAKFLFVPHFTRVNIITLNENSNCKFDIWYYMMSLKALLESGIITTSLIIREVEMQGEYFSMLMNLVSVCPISLELGWTTITNIEELKIITDEKEHQLCGLDITYSNLEDEGVQIVVEELINSKLIKKLTTINLQGNNAYIYDYRSALASYDIEIEG